MHIFFYTWAPQYNKILFPPLPGLWKAADCCIVYHTCPRAQAIIASFWRHKSKHFGHKEKMIPQFFFVCVLVFNLLAFWRRQKKKLEKMRKLDNPHRQEDQLLLLKSKGKREKLRIKKLFGAYAKGHLFFSSMFNPLAAYSPERLGLKLKKKIFFFFRQVAAQSLVAVLCGRAQQITAKKEMIDWLHFSCDI